jgi:hypothetical protein
VNDQRPKTSRFSWYEVLLGLVILVNLSGWVGYRFVSPIDETRALAYLALAAAFTACLISIKRRQ